MTREQLKTFFSLHVLLMLYSLTDLFGKLASGFEISDPRFIASYVAMLFILGIYALGWQQIIKRMPLTTAFSSKAITVLWGLVWGVLFFQEEITPLKVIGVAVIVAGVVLYAHADTHDHASPDVQESATCLKAPEEGGHGHGCP